MTIELPSDDEEILAEMLLDWEDSQVSSCPRSAQEICAQRPDLVKVLDQRIRSLQSLNPYILEDPREFLEGELAWNAAEKRPAVPIVAGYEILDEIGRGGMGVVYKARQISIGRLVAIKMIKRSLEGESNLVDRLRREAAALGRVNHEHVIQVFDVIDRNEGVHLILEYVDGGNLALRESGRPMEAMDAAQIVLTVAKTMADIHRIGLLHRDLKPANLLRDKRGKVKVSDFGLAKVQLNQSGDSIAGEMTGTPSYMAPEQILGRTAEIREWTDVYSIGATLYEFLTGRPPFAGASTVETLSQVLESEPVSPRLLVPHVPRDLETICLKCLAKEPQKRYLNADALADDLKRFLAGQPISARPKGPLELTWNWAKRHPDRASLVVVVILAISSLTALGAWTATRLSDAIKESQLQSETLSAVSEAAREHEFNARLASVTERAALRRLGWSWTNLDELKRVASFRSQVDQSALHRLRGEATKALVAFDVRKKCELLPGLDAYTLEFSPEGQTLAVGENSDDGEFVKVQLVSASTWEPLQTIRFRASTEWIKHRPDGVRSMAFSPDGTELYIGSRSGWMHVYNTQTWQPVRSWQAHSHYVHCIRFDSEQATVITCSEDKTAKRWHCDGRMISEFTHGSELVDCTIVRDMLVPQSSRIIFASDPPLYLNESDFQHHAAVHCNRRALGEGFAKVARFPDGGGWVRANESSFEILDSHYLTSLTTFYDRHAKSQIVGELHCLEISPDGRWLVSCTRSSAKLWDLIGCERIAEIRNAGGGRITARFHPMSNILAITGDRKVTVYDLSQESVWQQRLQQPHELTQIGLSADGNSVAATRKLTLPHQSNPDFYMQLVIAKTTSDRSMTAFQTLKTATASQMQFSPNGKRVGVIFPLAPSIHLVGIDGDNSDLFQTNAVYAEFGRFSPNGHQFYVSSQAPNDSSSTVDQRPGELHVFDVETLQGRNLWGNEESERNLRESKILTLEVGEKFLTCTSNDRTLRVLDRERGTVLTKVDLEMYCDALSMATDESYVVVGSRTGELVVVDIPSGKIRQAIHAHDDVVRAVVNSGTDLYVSGSRDRDLKLWKMDRGRLSELLALNTLSGPVKDLAACKDGHVVAVLIEGETAVRLLRIDLLKNRLLEFGLDW